jgi:hypothetical protein
VTVQLGGRGDSPARCFTRYEDLADRAREELSATGAVSIATGLCVLLGVREDDMTDELLVGVGVDPYVRRTMDGEENWSRSGGQDLSVDRWIRQDSRSSPRTSRLYRRWSVVDMLRFGAATNPRWDRERAESLIRARGIPRDQRVDRLSGGQRALVALALAVGK